VAPCAFADQNEECEEQGSTINKPEKSFEVEHIAPSIGDKLNAILKEYEFLKLDILNRSQYQDSYLKLHIIALTAILGGAISQKLGLWVLLLIPIESSIIGLWYLDHAFSITQMGEYIQKSIEPRVCKLLDEKEIMNWDTLVGHNAIIGKRKIFNARLVVYLTFGGSSFFILLVTFIVLIIYRSKIDDIFEIEPTYACVGWTIGFIFSAFYFLSEGEHSRLSAMRKFDEYSNEHRHYKSQK